MEPAGRLMPQDWMTAPETRAVVAALTAGGREVRYVGGCVRDAALGRRVKDIDLATPDPPETVMALLQRAGLKAVPTGLDHGTVTAVSGHHPFEITTLREDVETYGRHARVAFTDDWKADAARRDFTINALSCAPDGTLYDPFGGLDDLGTGRVRFVGDARQRIREDYLRLLRFFRFHAHYGHDAPDPQGLAAAAEFAPKLAGLSGERVRDELMKLLDAPDPAAVLRIMAAHRILEPVLPEATEVEALAALVALEAETGEGGDTLRRLAVLLDPARSDPDSLAERLRLSRHEREWLARLLHPRRTVAAELSGHELRVALYRLGAEQVRDLLLLDAARRRACGDALEPRAVTAALAETHAWHPKRFPLRGRDAKALGVPAGPRIGALLGQVEAWWQAEDFAPDREACLQRLEALVRQEAG